jgi:hypothetical protein
LEASGDPKKIKKGGGYVVDMSRFRQLQGQNKVVNPYGTISKDVIGKEKLSETEMKAAFSLKKNYNKNSSEEDEDEAECDLNESEYERV